MRTSLLLAFKLLMISILPGCELGSCTKGEGSIERTVRPVEPFRAMVLNSSIDVRLTPGTTQTMEIEAQTNLVELVKAEVNDGILTISVEDCFRTDGPFLVHLTTPSLETITIQGSGDIQGTGPMHADAMDLRVQGSGDMRLEIMAERLKATVQGSGDVFLSGAVGVLETRVQGSGDVRATELAAQDVKASIMGSGDIAVQCNGVLEASVMGSGDITYRGTPTGVLQNIKGSGSIRAME